MKNTKGRKVLLAARDPGAANVIAALYEPLKLAGHDVILAGKDHALAKYSAFGLQGTDVAEGRPHFGVDEALALLLRTTPDVVLTGTSAEDPFEKNLWQAAQQRGIPSAAILDQWMNYGIRFSRYTVGQMEQYGRFPVHDRLPDEIWVMDEFAYNQAVAAGLPEERLVVVGHPYFDYLLALRREERPVAEEPRPLRILFASEPISSSYSGDRPEETHYGYTEKTVFSVFLGELENMLMKTGLEADVIIRPHPRELPGNLDATVAGFDLKRTRIVTDLASHSLDLIQSADLVVGMSSMFLLESAILGVPILSVQIGLKRENPFILNRTGAVPEILSKERLQEALEAVCDGRSEAFIWNVEPGAIQSAIRRMEALACRN